LLWGCCISFIKISSILKKPINEKLMHIKISPAQKRSIFILLFLIPFLMGCAVNLYVPSLPAITQYFNVPKHPVQLTIALYMLGYAVGQIGLGVLSDSLGRRSIFIIGGAIFTLVSFL